MSEFQIYDDLDPEEFQNRVFDFGENTPIDEYNKFYILRPVFNYEFLDLGITEYNFQHEEFDKTDYQIYFEKVQSYSKKSLNELLDSDHNEHFHLYQVPSGKLLSLLKSILKKNSLRIEETPPVGQFALYTTKEEEKKSPRIFFFIGQQAVLYILFYDPFHDIRPMKKY